MAKKTGKKDLDTDLNLEELDFEDIDFEAEGMDLDDRNPSKSAVAKELSREAGKGFLSSLATKTAEKALPDSYTENYAELRDFADITKETFEKNASKLNKSVYRLGLEVKKVLPFQIKALNSYLEKQREEFDSFKQQTEEELRASSIQSNIASIFDKQLEVQQALEAKRSAEEDVDRRERIVSNKLSLSSLSNIDANTANHTAFTLQVSKEYYRKSLELQFKSYFIQADMLKTMRDYYKGFSLQFESIEKNTALPEFVKLQKTERLAEILRDQALEAITVRAFDKNKYLSKVKERMTKVVDNAISSVTDKIDDLSSNLSMINSTSEGGGGGLSMIAATLSNLLGGTIGEKLADKVSPKIKDKIKDNKYINTGANYLSMLANSPSTLFAALRDKVTKGKEEYADEGGPTRFLASKMFGGLDSLLEVTKTDSVLTDVKKASLLTHNKPAIFDNNAHRSITEVIPMYLSRILKENTDLSAMYRLTNSSVVGRYQGSSPLLYDYSNRKLTIASDIKANIEKDLLSTDAKKGKVASSVTAMLSSANKSVLEGKDKDYKKTSALLSDTKSSKLLSDYILKASNVEGIDFTYDTIIKDVVENKAPLELQELVSKNPKLLNLLNILHRNRPAGKTKEYIEATLTDVTQIYPTTSVKELFKSASRLAGKKTYNIVDTKVASILSKNFTAAIYKDNKDITVDSIVSGNFLRFFDGTDLNNTSVKNAIRIFVSECGIISASNDIQRISGLELSLGILNNSLREQLDVNPDIYQSIFDKYGSEILTTGELDPDMLIRRTLTRSDNKEEVDIETIRSIVKTKTSDADKIKERTIKETILDKSVSYTSSILNEIRSSDNIFDTIRVISREGMKAATTIKSFTSKSVDNLSKSINTSLEELGKLSDTAIKATVSTYTSKINQSINEVNKIIQSEKEHYELSLKNIEEISNVASDVIVEQSTIESIEKQKAKLTTAFERKNKALSVVKSTLEAQYKVLKNIEGNPNLSTVEIASKVKEALITTRDTLDKLVNGTGVSIATN